MVPDLDEYVCNNNDRDCLLQISQKASERIRSVQIVKGKHLLLSDLHVSLPSVNKNLFAPVQYAMLVGETFQKLLLEEIKSTPPFSLSLYNPERIK